MELEDRKEHVIRCIKLGMDLNSSMYCAECTEDEMELLKTDPTFTQYVKSIQAIEEMHLLEDHEIAMKIAAAKGNTSALQWKLERVNPVRWGKQNTGNNDNSNGGVNVTFEIPHNGRD